MAGLQFVDQHNMVAFLERLDENAEFHQIVDFLTTSSIHYALTVSLTIYASYIELFWATSKSKIVNDVNKIHAIVDGKTVVISESSVRSDLHFNYEDGIACLSNDEIFENLAFMGGQDTEIPQSSGPPKKVGDEAVYTGEDDRVVRAATTPSSLESEQESGNIHKTRPTETLNEPSPQGTGSGGHTPGSDEGRLDFSELINICTQLSNRVLALEQSKTAQDLVIIKLQKKVKRLEKALRARTLGMKLFKIGTSRKKSLDKENVSKQGKNDSTNKIEELNLSDKGSGGTKVFDDTTTAKKNVNAAEPVNAASVIPDVSVAGPSTSTTRDIFEDEMTTIVDTLVTIRSARPRTTSVVIRDVEEEPRRATPVPIVQSKDKEQRIAREKAAEQEAKDAALNEQIEDIQARMDADALLAERLQQEEREQFTVDEQARMLVDLIAEKKKYTHNQLKSKSFKEIQKLYEREQKWINDFVPMNDDSEKKDDDSKQQARSSKKRPRADPDEESAKKQKLEEDDAEKEKLRACLDIVPGDDIAMDFESLATKYPITDWKTHILTENMMYYQIIRADGSSKNYKIFNGILDDFDRQDVIDLYRLVKERYETTSLEGYDLLLWGDLKTLFEPSEEDEIRRNQHNYNLISWRLFDSCGVHVLLMDTRIAVHIMIENTYPFT
ncbi:hypothetical protein Tco_1123405 [Tanacetum coccineum]|uniref:Uncharacterized protein n=1 Tax=Tanacetum coccineum TaxID=301880 RepID=A0ABQ5J397_9ASTR